MPMMPTLRKPEWRKELKRKNVDQDIPDQITIIKKGNGQIPQPISTGEERGGRYTGTGPDGIMQPGKYAGDVHEGEMVLSANATQALPPDVRQELAAQAESGTLDINALRQALKINPQRGYATGSFGSPVRMPSTVPTNPYENPNLNTNDFNKTNYAIPENMQVKAPVISPITPAIQINTQPNAVPTFNTIPSSVASPKTISSPSTVPTPETPVVNTPSPSTITNTIPQPAAAPSTTVAQPRTMTGNQVTNIPEPLPIAVQPRTMDQQAVTNTVQDVPQPIVAGTRTMDVPQPIANAVPPAGGAGSTTTTQGGQTPASPYRSAFDQNLARIQDVAGGNSEIERNIANQNLRRYDTTAATDLAVADQQASMQNNIPETARAALGAEARSAVRSGRSELIGDMSQGAQERALGAAQVAGQMAMQGMTFDEARRQAGVSEDQWNKSFNESVRQFGISAEQWNKEFEEGKIRWNDQLKQFERTFAEDVRRFDTQFTEDQKRYGDSQNWLKFETALQIGSDTDVANAYFSATGKTLNPGAIEEYRGYARDAAKQSLQRGALELASMRTSQAGADLSTYVQNNPNATVENDPALRAAAQKYWEATGNTGMVPNAWASERVKAIRDAGNAIVTFNNDIDYAVSSGQISAEDGNMLKKINSTGVLQFYKTDADGKVVFDWEALAKATGTSTGTGTTTTGTATINGVEIKTPEGKEEGDIFEQDGKIYRVGSDNVPEVAISKDLTWDDIKGQGLDENSAAYKAVLANAEKLDLQYKSNTLTDSWKIAPEVGQVVKATVGGKEVLLKTTFKGTQDVSLGFDNAYIEFEDMQGNKYYAGGPDKGNEIKSGTARETTKSPVAGIVANSVINPIGAAASPIVATAQTAIPILNVANTLLDWIT